MLQLHHTAVLLFAVFRAFRLDSRGAIAQAARQHWSGSGGSDHWPPFFANAPLASLSMANVLGPGS